VKTTYTGDEADYMRGKLESSGMAETEKNYLDYYSKIYNKIEAKDSIIVTDDLKVNKLITIETYKVGDFFKKDSTSNKLNADLFANFIYNQFPSITGRIKTPVALTYPYDANYSIKVVLPGGWDINEDHDAINRGYYHYESDFTVTGDTLALNYKLSFLKDNVPVNKLDEFKADIKKLNNTSLGYSFSYTPEGIAEPSTVNSTLVLVAFLVTIGLIILGVWLYQRETPGIVFAYGSTFVPLGGWLIVIAIFLGGMVISAIWGLSTRGYFELSTWNSNAVKNIAEHRLIIVLESLGNIILACYAMFCLALLLNRRDILPQYIIGFFVYRAVVSIADYYIAYDLYKTVSDAAMQALAGSFVMAAICVPYFKKSARVQETFIVPHPPYNYSYEGPGGSDASVS
jgi:hypothetical protein